MIKTAAEDFNKRLSENIAKYRKLNGLSQAELGNCIGYSNKSVSKWERNEGVPDAYTLYTISEVFGISVSELIGQAPKSKDTVSKLKAAEKDAKALARAKKKAMDRASKRKLNNKK